jgi:hypothetical protein
MFVEREELSDFIGRESGKEEHIGGSVTRHNAMGQHGGRNTFRRQFLGGLADGQCIWLREEVGHQLVVVAHFVLRQVDRMLRTAETDEINGDNLTLVEQLEEGMLRVWRKQSRHKRNKIGSSATRE